MTLHHWLAFGAVLLIVVALIMVMVAAQEWWEWRNDQR
jgi:hypothetical protein